MWVFLSFLIRWFLRFVSGAPTICSGDMAVGVSDPETGANVNVELRALFARAPDEEDASRGSRASRDLLSASSSWQNGLLFFLDGFFRPLRRSVFACIAFLYSQTVRIPFLYVCSTCC